MSLWTRITGKNNLTLRKAEGIGIALEILNKFEGRLFTVKDGTGSYKNVPTTDLRTYLQTKLPDYYGYETHLKTHLDRIGNQQLDMTLTGHIGLSSSLKRYNPMDVKISIKSEP